MHRPYALCRPKCRRNVFFLRRTLAPLLNLPYILYIHPHHRYGTPPGLAEINANAMRNKARKRTGPKVKDFAIESLNLR